MEMNLDLARLHLLIKLFYGFKFGIDEDQKDEILRGSVFSDLFNEILLKYLEASSKVALIEDEVNWDEWQLKRRKNEFLQIKDSLLKFDDWTELDDHIKEILVRNMFSPFFFNDSEVSEVKTFLDSWDSPPHKS